MLEAEVKPHLSSYNLLLKAAQHCGVGDDEFRQELLEWKGAERLQRITDKKKNRPKKKKHLMSNLHTSTHTQAHTHTCV